ncbi:MAG: carboxypeptidase regulatory-like domain-containing protein [Candidatus Acidiferrales bacterium]
MRGMQRSLLVVMVWLCVFAIPSAVVAQTGNSSTISGTVLDPSGAVVANATVTIQDPVSGYHRSVRTDSSGNFSFPNVPFNPYHLTVTARGFASYVQDVDVSSTVPVSLKISMQLAGTSTTVTVEAGAGDLLENTPTTHTDIDRTLIDKLPLESQTSSLSSVVTLSAPGVTADSNGLFHGIGDHASNSFSLDGQPITDQQSKVFSNQIPLDAIQSVEVIEGAPPAEYGDKTSLVIDVTTRSGQGVTTPHGSVTASYGTFGTSNAGFDLAYGGQKWGNYVAVGGLNTGRFLDPPEFAVMHDKGNEENVFDRVDYRLSSADSLQLNVGYTRSWFQNPNSFDNLNTGLTEGALLGTSNTALVGPTDQRSQIGTVNIAPTWTHLISSSTVFTLGAFVRRDDYHYYPSGNPLADIGPPSLQRETVGQHRTLANAGLRSDLSYVKGIHNIKAGVTYQQTFLTENDTLGVVDPILNAPCLNASNVAVAGFTDSAQCAGAGLQPNIASNPNAPNSALYPLFNPVLLPFDLTRSGGLFPFNGHTDVKELALYVQDAITAGSWSFNLGIRGDLYNGITTARQAEPRLGVAYNIKRTNTVLRVSYARSLETPFNENLVLSSTGCNFGVIAALVPACLRRSLRASEMHFTQACSKPSESTSWWMANTCGYIRTMASTSPIWATHRSISPSNGTTPRPLDMPFGRACLTSTASPPLSSSLTSTLVSLLLKLPVWAPYPPYREAGPSPSALIMTRTSTKRLTSSISRGNRVHGSASTGGMTADSLPARPLVTESWQLTLAQARFSSTVCQMFP